MERFQRAEAATFWGREIGLMYMHAHLRFLEALARLGETEALWEQLLHAIPAGLAERVRGAAVRQANTYFSSSDAAFADREEATARARDLFDPATVFEGGWRVYSSGPGLLLRLTVEDVLGVRRRAHGVEIDPVLPRALDGVSARIPFDGGWITVRYERGERGCGLERVEVDGVAVTGEPVRRRYRAAGLVLAPGTLRDGASLVVRTA